MTAPGFDSSLEQQIAEWRSFLRHRQAIHNVDVAELEDHLREQMTALMAAGLKGDEAFLVAVKRMGALDALSREFASEHSERLWKQLVVVQPDSAAAASGTRDGFVALALAVVAALLLKLPGFFGYGFDSHETFYARNIAFFVLPPLTAYFVWKRRLAAATVRWLLVAFAVALVAANVYPLTAQSSTLTLSAMHLPIALWLAVGVAYAGGRWRLVAGRMDFIRFSGELFIYYALIAAGGGVLTGLLLGLFKMIGVDAEPFVQQWLVPCGAAGAVIVASWLVEAKQSVIENMAPVLTRLFIPLFAALLVTFLAALLVTGRGVEFQREMLILFDLVLVLVVALLLYSISARDPAAPPGLFDVLSVVLVIAALLADLFALWTIAARITEFGFTPNRVAALGENVILLVNLAWSAMLYVRFIRRRGSQEALERWQTAFLPVYAGWAAIVVIVFPPLFKYV
jgi:hypothetical protein